MISQTQAPRIPTETPFVDKNSQSGVSFAWIQALQALQTQKPFNPSPVSVTPYIVGSVYNVTLVTTGAGAFTVNLGPSKGSPFSFYVVVKVDVGAGAITIKPKGADTINGAASVVQPATQWRVTVLIPDGKSNWVAFSLTGGG
jgi:hypothetical protein